MEDAVLRCVRNWTDKDTDILKEFINSRQPFTIMQIQEKIPMKPGTIRKHIATLAKQMDITVRNVTARNQNLEMVVEWDKKPKSVRSEVEDTNTIAEKFMCKCLCDGDTVWIAMIGKTRKEVTKWVMEDYTGIEKVLQVYSRMEYAKVRLDRQGRITARYGLGGNSVGHYVGKGGRK
jgi:hypothetical protein